MPYLTTRRQLQPQHGPFALESVAGSPAPPGVHLASLTHTARTPPTCTCVPTSRTPQRRPRCRTAVLSLPAHAMVGDDSEGLLQVEIV